MHRIVTWRVAHHVWGFFVVIAGVFAPIAATMAFLTTYEELGHHPLSRGEIVKKSLHMAAVTLVFFVVFTLGVGAALTAVLKT